MAYRYIIVIITLLNSVLPIAVSAQSYWSSTDSIFGSNPLLYNGKLYSANVPLNTSGDPFFAGNEFMKGQVTLKDKTYTDLDLNYDIYSQLLLLKYDNSDGATLILDLSKSWLSGFSFNRYNFEYHSDLNSQGTIFQVIQIDSVKILYAWKKEIQLRNFNETSGYTYSKPKRTQFIRINDMTNSYHNKKELLGVFPEMYQKQMALYMKTNKIKVNKASDDKMLGLLEFYRTLLSK